jgi:8-amino-7-oxononanoate synthase
MFPFVEESLRDLGDRHLLRAVRELKNFHGLHAELNGRGVILFCSNDYLGLSQHPEVIEEFCRGAQENGVGAGAARLISGSTEWHRALEEKLADLKGKPRALLFSTGYQANVGVISALAEKGDLILVDKLSHASIIDGARLAGAEVRFFPHKNYDRCDEILRAESAGRKTLLISDTVFSMDGDLADFEALVRLRDRYGCLLILDDAHGTGVFGPTGAGPLEKTAWEDRADVLVGTLSKAVGCLGGFAAASGSLIDYLINHARSFIFSTSLPAAVCRACIRSLDLMRLPGLRQKLWENIRQANDFLMRQSFLTEPIEGPILPVILKDEKKALEASGILLEEGIMVPAVRYPAVGKGKARLRLTLSAQAARPDLAALERALAVMKKRVTAVEIV